MTVRWVTNLRNLNKLFLIAAAALAAILPRSVEATVIVGADLGELARDARAVALGRVASVEGRWTDDRRTIETIVTLEVEQYFKGSLGSVLQFRVPGGELGRFRSIVVGAPELRRDERIVVFLGAVGPMVPFVLGLNQGVYRVVPSREGALLVTPPPMMPAASPVRIVRGDASRRPMPLADFAQRVRALAGAAR
jgi:hypothetical protein